MYNQRLDCLDASIRQMNSEIEAMELGLFEKNLIDGELTRALSTLETKPQFARIASHGMYPMQRLALVGRSRVVGEERRCEIFRLMDALISHGGHVDAVDLSGPPGYSKRICPLPAVFLTCHPFVVDALQRRGADLNAFPLSGELCHASEIEVPCNSVDTANDSMISSKYRIVQTRCTRHHLFWRWAIRPAFFWSRAGETCAERNISTLLVHVSRGTLDLPPPCRCCDVDLPVICLDDHMVTRWAEPGSGDWYIPLFGEVRLAVAKLSDGQLVVPTEWRVIWKQYRDQAEQIYNERRHGIQRLVCEFTVLPRDIVIHIIAPYCFWDL